MEWFNVTQLHSGVCMKPWHLIQNYKALWVTGYLEIMYGAGMHKVRLWTSPFYSLIFLDIRERHTAVHKGSI